MYHVNYSVISSGSRDTKICLDAELCAVIFVGNKASRYGNNPHYLLRNLHRRILQTFSRIPYIESPKGDSQRIDAPHGKKAEFGREVRTINFFHF